MRPPKINPVAILCRQLNVTPDVIAAKLGLQKDHVESALLAQTAREPMGTLLRIISGMKLKLRVTGKPFVFWVRTPAIDRLLQNKQWRASQGFCESPPTRPLLVALAKKMLDGGMTKSDVARVFHESFVPTALENKFEWSERAIGTLLDRPSVKRGWVLKPHETAVNRFRRWAIESILPQLLPHDPGAALRYRMEVTHGRFDTIVRSALPVPDILAEWMEQSILELGWFADDSIGFGSDPPMSHYEKMIIMAAKGGRNNVDRHGSPLENAKRSR